MLIGFTHGRRRHDNGILVYKDNDWLAVWSAKIHGQLPNFTYASPGILKVENGHCSAAMSGLRTAETTSNCTGQGKWSFNPSSVHDHAALNVWNAKSGLSVQNVHIDQWCPVVASVPGTEQSLHWRWHHPSWPVNTSTGTRNTDTCWKSYYLFHT